MATTKQSGETSERGSATRAVTHRTLRTDERGASPSEPELRQPDERDESADEQGTEPRPVIKQALADLENGQQDTDARNRVAEILPDVPKTPQNFDETSAQDQTPRVRQHRSGETSKR